MIVSLVATLDPEVVRVHGTPAELQKHPRRPRLRIHLADMITRPQVPRTKDMLAAT